MFKNCVFKASVDTKKWLKSAGVRAVKTAAQAAIAGIGTAAAMGQVDWKYVLSASVLAGVISILTSIAGIPETPAEETEKTEDSEGE
ncbi:MAG: hypothetical protein KH330_14710 [Clostridiales bacterium]|nr:hypothetical protein [Clostridiales bacterium]